MIGRIEMMQAAVLFASLVWGVLLGLAYFGALRWTVARLLHTRHPGLLLAGSLLVRLALLAAGLLVVLGGSWPRALACLAGVLLARTLLVRKEARSCG